MCSTYTVCNYVLWIVTRQGWRAVNPRWVVIQNNRVEVLETVALELMVYLNMLFEEWMKHVPALCSLVPVNDNEEYFNSSNCHVHESEKSEHLYFDGPLADFKVGLEMNEDYEVSFYTLSYERDDKRLTYRVSDIISLGQKMAMLAFGHAGNAFVECETRIFEKTGPSSN